MKRYIVLSALTLLLGMVSAPAAQASTRFSVQIGPSAAFAPYDGYVWRPGYYVRVGFRYRWIPGAWVPRAYAGRALPYRFDRDRRYGRDDRWDRYRRDRGYWNDRDRFDRRR
jgi:hypothetical protein